LIQAKDNSKKAIREGHFFFEGVGMGCQFPKKKNLQRKTAGEKIMQGEPWEK